MVDLMAAFPREHRVQGVLFDYPSLLFSLIGIYLAVVLKFGPEYMKYRKPFNVRPFARLFNAFQIAANLWFSYHSLSLAWRYRSMSRFNLFCTPPTTQQPNLEFPGDTERLVFLGQMYLYVRILDFLDTLMFILSKKFSHVTFLHVYHHAIVVSTGYIYIRSGWGNTLFYLSVMNALTHSVMYTYYFLSTYPEMRPYLGWKRHLTALQIGQFFLMAGHTFTIIAFNCGLPLIVLQYNMAQIVLFIFMFSRFYMHHYRDELGALAENLPPPPPMVLNANGTALGGPQAYWNGSGH